MLIPITVRTSAEITGFIAVLKHSLGFTEAPSHLLHQVNLLYFGLFLLIAQFPCVQQYGEDDNNYQLDQYSIYMLVLKLVSIRLAGWFTLVCTACSFGLDLKRR